MEKNPSRDPQQPSAGVFALPNSSYFCIDDSTYTDASNPPMNLADLPTICDSPLGPQPSFETLIKYSKTNTHSVVYAEHLIDSCNPSSYGSVSPDGRYRFELTGNSTKPTISEGFYHFEFDFTSTCETCFSESLHDPVSAEFVFDVDARMVGPSIVACEVKYPDGELASLKIKAGSKSLTNRLNCRFKEEGDYLLEVKVTRLPLANNQHQMHPITVNHIAHRSLIKMSAFESSAIGRSSENNNISDYDRPCESNDEYSQGRWVRTNDSSIQDDEIGYSTGYTWKPWSCQVRRYSYATLRSCLQGKTIAFSGDSLGREVMFLFYQQFLDPKLYVDLDGREYQGEESNKNNVFITWRQEEGEQQSANTTLKWMGNFNTDNHGISVVGVDYFFLSMGMILRIFDSQPFRVQHSPVLIKYNKAKIDLLARLFGDQDAPLQRVIVHGNPHIQHRSVRSGHETQFERISGRVTKAATGETNKYAAELGMSVVPGRELTDARWFSSHDGIHYSFSTFQAEFRESLFEKQWQGGASSAQVLILQDLICRE